MRQFIDHLTERNFQNRTVAFIENGTWSPLANKLMKEKFANSKNLTFINTCVTIRSALKKDSKEALAKMADELTKDYKAFSPDKADKNDMTALFRINGMICNTVTQLTDSPNRIGVNINKQNYTYHVIKQTGKLNINCLSVEAPFSVFQQYGFQSGRTADKFAGEEVLRSDNGLRILPHYINAMMSLEVESYVDLDTHGMFICTVTEARVMSDKDTMTYTYYQKNVKPKPETKGKKGWVCTVCVYQFWFLKGGTDYGF